MRADLILSVDQGTTSCRAFVFNSKGEIIARSQQEIRQFYPQKGWVEHDAIEIWHTQKEVVDTVVKEVGADRIGVIGIANQRETTVVWNKDTGCPIYNALVWQDQRTIDYCEKLVKAGMQEYVRNTTGLIVDTYFSATKIAWILDHVEGARDLASKGKLCFGTLDSWLIWNFTGGKHCTEFSNASRTLLFDIHRLAWDDTLLDFFQIPKSMLPEVVNSNSCFGEVDLFGHTVPIRAVMGDQQAALFGQSCWESGAVKNTYGTGCFTLMNTGVEAVHCEKGLLTTIAWKTGEECCYALEGSVFIGGAGVQWLRDEMGLLSNAQESEEMARHAKDKGVYLVPAFSGMGTPYWDMNACGAIFGLTRDSNKNDLVKATLDAICYQSHDVLKVMEESSKIHLTSLRVDGGASSNDYLMQFQADISNVPVLRPKELESTAWGVAMMAGLAANLWTMNDLNAFGKEVHAFTPKKDEVERKEKLKGWHKAVQRSLAWYAD